jgi:hypothetical protein
MFGVAFGHHDLQTLLPRHTPLYAYFSCNPRSLDEMKHNTEKTVARTDPETLHKIA